MNNEYINPFLLDRLPYSIRVLLESAVRNCDEFHVTKKDVETILDWNDIQLKETEISFKPSRVILQVWIYTPPFWALGRLLL